MYLFVCTNICIVSSTKKTTPANLCVAKRKQSNKQEWKGANEIAEKNPWCDVDWKTNTSADNCTKRNSIITYKTTIATMMPMVHREKNIIHYSMSGIFGCAM